jgi:hypothetical protein
VWINEPAHALIAVRDQLLQELVEARVTVDRELRDTESLGVPIGQAELKQVGATILLVARVLVAVVRPVLKQAQ